MILGILQARMSSTRLPGKVLEPVLGRPMIARQAERLRRSRRIDRLVVATSDQPGDDVLARACADLDLPVHRGSLDDVLDRFHGALAAFGPAGTVVRMTADCPLADWTLIDRTIETHLQRGDDYTSNTPPARTFPHGLDVEVMRASVLETAWREAVDPYEREHVTPFIYRRPERFALGYVSDAPSLAHLRWTVDHPADLAFVRYVYETLYPSNPAFTSADVVALPRNSSELPS
ncbi:MAG: cytidylyltransferase domain-containing protein [Phenylobacterium sp.]|uniref:cytidylyltransferase domain-containing protein n=1 Tax=Phenylobacterium sp. TaxID=1871053 RepID=UPI003919E5DC